MTIREIRDLRIERGKFAKPRNQPVDADSRRGRHLEVAARPLAAVGELGARRLQLHEDIMRGAEQQVTLFGQDQPARMAMKQRYREFLLQRADLPRYGRLRQPELFAGMREAPRFCRGVKHFQLVPIHVGNTVLAGYSAAARSPACEARNRSASSAAMQPRPAAVTAWR